MLRFAAFGLAATLYVATFVSAQAYSFSECPIPSPPRCASVLAGSTKEKAFVSDYKNIATNSRVSMTEAGQVKVCNYPVPLDPATCKPVRKGALTWCPPGAKQDDECTTLVKDGSIPSEFNDAMAKFSSEALDRAVAARTAEILGNLENLRQTSGGIFAISVTDPYGILVPISDTEPIIDPDAVRYVQVPVSALNDISPSNVGARIQALYLDNPDLATAPNQQLFPPADFYPYYSGSLSLKVLEMSDSGIAVGQATPRTYDTRAYTVPFSTFIESGTGIYTDSGRLEGFTLRAPIWNTPSLDPFALPKPHLVSYVSPAPQPPTQGFFARVGSLFSSLFGI